MSKEYQTKEYWNRRTRENRNNMEALLFRDPRFLEYQRKTAEFLGSLSLTLDVIDIACGPGRFAHLYSPNHYIGVDFSEEMIKLAGEKNPGYKFQLADAHDDLDLPKVNIVFEVNSLHCLEMTPDQFLKKYKKFATSWVVCLEADQFTAFPIY